MFLVQNNVSSTQWLIVHSKTALKKTAPYVSVDTRIVTAFTREIWDIFEASDSDELNSIEPRT